MPTLMLLVPKVIESFRARFPETTRNAYPYFNYDNRVVDESVYRGDVKAPYKGPDDLTDTDYANLVRFAKGIVNPILAKYSTKVACEDALSRAIRSFGNGLFDGKVNAGRYNVLLKSMMTPAMPTVMAKKEKKEKKEERLSPTTMKQLGLKRKDIPGKERVRQQVRKNKAPVIYRTKGRTVIKKAAENQYMMDFLAMIPELPCTDLDTIRKLSGRWGQAKKAIKEFLSVCREEMDKDYVARVDNDFEKAAKILDRLEKLYNSIKEFDMVDIKTYMEPLMELAEKAKGGDPEPEAPAPEIEETETETEEMTEPKEGKMLKNASEYTEKLDKIAEEVQQFSPEVALQIDMVSDVIDGRRDASTLQFDADEARYMANRFNYDVRSREADEPYMDNFNKSDFEQVMREKKSPKPVRKASALPYQRVQ